MVQIIAEQDGFLNRAKTTGIISKNVALDLAPVSYTHLDVYKRQVVPRKHNFRPLPGAGVLFFYRRKNMREELQALKAVSYTHLDVYKRQEHKSPSRKRNFRKAALVHKTDHERVAKMLPYA